MVVHVAAGAIGLVSGAVALSVRKGGRIHGLSGDVFLVAMLTAASLGAYLGVLQHRGGLLIGGILTCYFLTTAWLTVRRAPGTIGGFERFAPFGAMVGAVLGIAYGIRAIGSPMAMFEAIPAPAYFSLAFVAVLAVGFDAKVILNGGIAGAPRIARHLWRLCLGLFEATSAFFIGQQKVMPIYLHGSPVLLALGVAPLVLMAFWLSRLRFTKWFSTNATSSRFGLDVASAGP
jgi:uncharacterized membrane protein